MEDSTVEGNKLIAAYMDAKFSSVDAYGNGDIRHYAEFDYGFHPSKLIKNAGRKFELKELMYHESYDWLMPVVEKIGSTIKGEKGGILFLHLVMYSNLLWTARLMDLKIEKVWEAVVEFINFYNNQQSNG